MASITSTLLSISLMVLSQTNAQCDFRMWRFDDLGSVAASNGWELVPKDDMISGSLHDEFVTFMAANNDRVQSLGSWSTGANCLYYGIQPCTIAFAVDDGCQSVTSWEAGNSYTFCPWNGRTTIAQGLQEMVGTPHDTCIAIYKKCGSCVNEDCDDQNECTDDSCNDITGECEHTDIVCNDDNACTEDTCDPLTGCINSDITCADDGNVCNGDEGCSEGECVSDGIAPVCQDWQVCEPGRGCIRNCDEFDIDSFLLECSDEFSQNEEQLNDMIGRLDGLEATDTAHNIRLGDLEGRLGVPTDDGLDNPAISLWELVEQQHAEFEKLKERVYGWSTHEEDQDANANVGDLGFDDGYLFKDTTSFWYKYQNQIVLCLIFSNILLMISLFCVFNKSTKVSKKRRYLPVQFDSSTDEEQHIPLKKK